MAGATRTVVRDQREQVGMDSTYLYGSSGNPVRQNEINEFPVVALPGSDGLDQGVVAHAVLYFCCKKYIGFFLYNSVWRRH